MKRGSTSLKRIRGRADTLLPGDTVAGLLVHRVLHLSREVAVYDLEARSRRFAPDTLVTIWRPGPN